MRRNRARGALIAGVTVALVGLGFVLGRTMAQRREASEGTAPPLRADVSQRISDFRRVKVKDGRQVWELTAREAEYFEDQGNVLVTEPQVSFFGADGQNIEVKGRQGRIFVSGNNIDKIELSGGIEVHVGEYLVRTEEAIYVQAQDAIVSAGRVRVDGGALSLDGKGLLVELARQKLTLLKGVTTTVRGSDASAPTAPAPAGSGSSPSAEIRLDLPGAETTPVLGPLPLAAVDSRVADRMHRPGGGSGATAD